MSYAILVKPAAQRQIKKLPIAAQRNLIGLIEQLAEVPRPPGHRKLKGRQNQYRIRSGDYRVIYSIEERALTISVIKVGHRRDVYEDP